MVVKFVCIIQQFTPIYKSENPIQVSLFCKPALMYNFAQVAYIMVGFLMKILKDVSPSDWDKFVLAYDNM